MATPQNEVISGTSSTASPASATSTAEPVINSETADKSPPSSPLPRKKQRSESLPSSVALPVKQLESTSTVPNESNEKNSLASGPEAREPGPQISNSSGMKPKKPAPKKSTTKSAIKKTAPSRSSRKSPKARVPSGPPPPPKPKRINKVVKAKVKAVGDFLDNTPVDQSVLRRSHENADHVVVTELAAIAALKTMVADYGISNPSWTSLVDIKDIVVDAFVEPLGQNPVVKFTTLDLSRTSAFEEAIHQKIAGWELDGINLLEAELEMNARQLERVAAETLFRNMMADESEVNEDAGERDVRVEDSLGRRGFGSA
ncbi:unnamed protein product [Zymoseptoria tritici ST99CH_3D7]|uniref:Uncharacterized protein n=1 Tax=Zymoseptoria tritici (strain ST99CH_3D7) TaxID=1276538 RepID=A0A1X7RDV7_ZYMT9|nr:unnamed protein product [Zymoseptoria tritici ST99CH_3D7]